MNVIALPIVARRVLFLYRLITRGPAGARPRRGRHRTARRRGEAPGRRGLRPEEAAQVERPRGRALLRVLGLPDPGQRLPRGVRRPVRPALRDPAHRPLGRARLPPGLHRADGARGHHHVRGDPAAELAGAARPAVPLQGLPPRRRLGRAVHDLQRHLVAVPVPRGGLGAGQPALQERRLHLDRRRQPARRTRPRAPSRPWSTSACCSTSASCWSSSSTWCTPSTCTSSSRRST